MLLQTIKRLCLVLTIVLISSLGFPALAKNENISHNLRPDDVVIENLRVTSGRLSVAGRVYYNPINAERIRKNKTASEKEPIIILIHGFTGSLHYWNPAIFALLSPLDEEGYFGHDYVFPFNLSNHGLGDLQTLVNNPKPGDYSFDEMINRDPKAFAEIARQYVFEKEGVWRQVVFVGHSLGGMTSINANFSEEELEMVRGLWIAGSPQRSMDTMTLIKELMATKTFADAISSALKRGIHSLELQQGVKYEGLARISQKVPYVVIAKIVKATYALRKLLSPVMNVDNLTVRELVYLFEKAASSPHKEMTDDLLAMLSPTGRGYQSLNGDVVYQHRPVLKPTVLHNGTSDGIAFGLDEGLQHQPLGLTRILHQEGRSHMDMVYGKYNVPMWIKYLSAFARNPFDDKKLWRMGTEKTVKESKATRWRRICETLLEYATPMSITD